MTPYKHSLPLAVLFVHAFLLLASTVSARPTTTRPPSDPRAVPTEILNDDNIQTMETVQVFTMSGGNTTETCTLIRTSTTTANGQDAVVFSKNCSFVFTSTSSPTPTPAPVSPSQRSNASVTTTFITSTAPASTRKVLFSMFTTDAPPVSASTIINPTTTSSIATATAATSHVATTPGTDVDDTALSTAPSESTSLPFPTSTPSSSSADPFTATAQSHLSSLPIFLGAFGGIAGLALLVVGIKVYRPVQRFNEMRLRTSSVASTRAEWGLWGLKRWKHSGERDNEKLTRRNSQDTEPESGHSHEPPSAWIS